MVPRAALRQRGRRSSQHPEDRERPPTGLWKTSARSRDRRQRERRAHWMARETERSPQGERGRARSNATGAAASAVRIARPVSPASSEPCWPVCAGSIPAPSALSRSHRNGSGAARCLGFRRAPGAPRARDQRQRPARASAAESHAEFSPIPGTAVSRDVERGARRPEIAAKSRRTRICLPRGAGRLGRCIPGRGETSVRAGEPAALTPSHERRAGVLAGRTPCPAAGRICLPWRSKISSRTRPYGCCGAF